MLRLRAVLATSIAAILVSPLGATPVQAAQGGSISIAPSGVVYDGCQRIPYRLDLPAGMGSTWSVDVTLRGPDGLEASSDFVYSGAPTPDGLQVCAYSANPGRYSVTADAEYYDLDSGRTYKFSLTPASISLREPRSRATAKASASRVKKGRTVKIRTQVRDERPSGFFPTAYATVRLEERVKGRWRSVRGTSTMTDSRGRASLPYVGRGRKTQLRVGVLTNDVYANSASKVLKLKKK